MKRMFALLLAVLLLAGCGANTTTPEEAVPVEETATEQQENTNYFGTFSAETLAGETVTEEIFSQAELTVVNLWATYCGPCKQEMPVLGMLHNELDQVQVVGIVMDCNDQQGNADPAQVELATDLMEAAGADYTNLILNADLAMLGMAAVEAVPATLFVDSLGNLVGQGFYGALDETQWRETIAARLELTAQ